MLTNQEIQLIEDKMNRRGVRQLDELSHIERIKSTWGHGALSELKMAFKHSYFSNSKSIRILISTIPLDYRPKIL